LAYCPEVDLKELYEKGVNDLVGVTLLAVKAVIDAEVEENAVGLMNGHHAHLLSTWETENGVVI
jgi:hypothetical protein